MIRYHFRSREANGGSVTHRRQQKNLITYNVSMAVTLASKPSLRELFARRVKNECRFKRILGIHIHEAFYIQIAFREGKWSRANNR